MPIPSSELAAHLAAAVAPHLGLDATSAGSLPKAVAKTLKRLAKHLAKQQQRAANGAGKRPSALAEPWPPSWPRRCTRSWCPTARQRARPRA